MQVEGYLRPATLAEALAALAEEGAVPLAGATDLGVEANLGGARPRLLVAIDHLPELREIQVGASSVDIGAALSLTEIERRLDGAVPLLDAVFPQFASRLIRNGATIGGNVGTASPIGDLPPALLALDASVVLVSTEGERVVPLTDYFTGYRETVLQPGELIASVRVPLPLAPLTGFHKIAKRRFDDISSVAVAFAIDVVDGVVTAGGDRARRSRGDADPGDRRGAGAGRAALGRGDRRSRSRRTGRCRHPDRRPPGQRRVPSSDARPSAAQAVRRSRCGMSRLSERPVTTEVGEARPHESAALHVTGRALYTDDIALRTPYLLHAHPVNAPHAHAMITRLDPKPAYDVPGVVRVLTADDVPGINGAGAKNDEPLFPTEVMFHGHAVAWVLGESLEAARIGAAAVEVDYEPLPSLITVVDAIEAESFQGGRPRLERGDVAAGLEGSAHVFEGEIDFAGQEHFYLETHASLAMVDDAGQVFIESSTQHPSETQEIVAHALGLASNQVTVQCVRMGGGFGGKEAQSHGFAAVAALGAVLTGRPVRVRLTRQQDMTMSGKRHGFHATWKVGFDDDGHLQALEATLTSDGGWCLDLSEPVLSRALCHIDNAYWIPHVRVDGRVARTHKTSQTAFRGFGGPQGMLVIEDILGRCAPMLGIDPADLRRRNFYTEGQATPYGQPVRHAERLDRAWQQVLDTGDVESAARRDRPRQRREPPFQAGSGDHAGEVRHLLQLHRVQPGRGARARLQGRLGAHQPRRHRDGAGPPHQDAAGRGDRARPADRAGAAGADAHRQGAQHVGHRGELGRRPQRRGGQGRLRPDPRPAWRRSVSGSAPVRPGRRSSTPPTTTGSSSGPPASTRPRACRGTRGPCRASRSSTSPTASPPPRSPSTGSPAPTEVERVDIVHDVGDSLSPLVDIGQIEGGFVQGVGWLTLEDLRWDVSNGPGRGRLATQAASTYKLPSLSEMPADLRVTLLDRATEDGAVYGSKAVGEPPLMLAFAVREALREAVAAFGSEAVSVELASPATPEAVYWAIEGVRA